MTNIYWWILVVSLVRCYNAAHQKEIVTLTSIVNTNSGPMQGQSKLYNNGKTVKQFIGIPFAKPPVGNLRFRKPEPMPQWTDTYDATSYQASCMQYLFTNDEWLIPNKNISEDCLHLNIFVPESESNAEKKAVMVWIHGGGFTAGQSSLFDASYLALQGDVIVVTINYRLGLFGFLSTNDDNARGNYGIWDQVLAIKWVHENIMAFGGDTSNVCIFGESAGGYSVGLHTTISKNKGRFQRAISESGTVYSPRVIATDTDVVASNAAKLLNCFPDTNITVMVDCIRSRPAEDLLAIQNEAWSDFKEPANFLNRVGPVIDGDLIPRDPISLLNDRQSDAYKLFTSLDIMAGTNNAEGGLMYWRMVAHQSKYNFNIAEGIPSTVLCGEVAQMVSRSYYADNVNVADAVCRQYKIPNGTLEEQGRSILNVYGDLQFVIPTVKTLETHSMDKTVRRSYQYIFTHQPSFSWIQDRPPWLHGANHAGELPFVFGPLAMYPPNHMKPIEEISLSEKMMTYWSNFAKHGNPNGADDGLGSRSSDYWPTYKPETRYYMNLSVVPTYGQRLYSDRVKFWTETVTNIEAKTTNGAGRTETAFVFVLFGLLCESMLILTISV